MVTTSISPTVSVVIPVLDGALTIREQLDALERQSATAPWEVIIADNGSTDDTVQIVRGHSITQRVPVSVIDASATRGVNHARNCGVRAARADIIAICDADDRVDAGWVQAYADGLTECTMGMAAGPTTTDDINEPRFRLHNGHVRPFTFGPYVAGIGANFGFQRHVWEQLGGFDESFIGGFDEIDFMIRAQKAGIPLMWLPDAVVHYRFATSMRAIWRRHLRRGMMRVRMSQLHPDVLKRQSLIRVSARVPKRTITLIHSTLRRRHVTAIAPLAYDIGIVRALWRARHQ